MKKVLISLIALLSAGSLAAQEGKTIPSKITEATVFFSGAELTHTANTTLARGENQLSIEGLSPTIDLNSLKIKSSGSVVVSSYEFSIDYLASAKAAGPEIQKLKDSISFYQAKLDKVNIDLKINADMIGYLKAGVEKNVSGSEAGLGIDDLVKTMDYYKAKSVEMETLQTALNKQKVELGQSIQRLQAQLNQESLKGSKTSGVLKLTLSAPAAGNTNFTVTYFTSAAGWSPYYDINIASTDRPIVIAGKSKVRQTTGLDWERVKLTLSTATPSNGKIAPLFNAWFLQPIVMRALSGRVAEISAMQNAYSYDEMALEEVVVMGYGIQKRTNAPAAPAAPAEPLYVIDGVPSTAAQYRSIDPSMIKSVERLENGAVDLYGSQAAAGVFVVTLKSGMDDFVTAQENDLNVVYTIDLPYTIPGNGKAQNIDLQSRETTAEYKYYCAPKLDTETYLLAEISDWQNLGLLSAPANVTYDGTYIGETFIDASSTQAKLSLTLGTDRRVAVKREKMQDFSSTRTLGSNTEQTFTYQITVKNNQTRPVNMVLKDQYPISTDKNIVVTLNREQTTAWTANVEDLGVITWEGELAAGETRTYRISYTVKYPKGMNLNL